MAAMRHFILALGTVLSASWVVVDAWAARTEPGTIKSQATGYGALGALVVTALIVGVSLMSPRRTHQD